MIDKRVVWITGASSGIGEALAITYSAAGWFVVLSARSTAKLEVVKNRLKDPGASLVMPLDVTLPLAAEEVAGQISASLGRLDLLINSAGMSQRSMIINTDLEAYRKLIDVNYLGSVYVTKAALGLLIANRGTVAVMSSIAGKIGAPKRSGYAASKHALHGFFDCLRAELSGSGVGVSILCPGYVNTDIDLHALGHDGKPTGKEDRDNRNGMSPEVLADKIYTAIAKRKQEAYFGGAEVLAVYLKRYMPRLLSRLLAARS